MKRASICAHCGGFVPDRSRGGGRCDRRPAPCRCRVPAFL